MRRHLLRFFINALALCAAVWLVPGLRYQGTPVRFALVVVVFSLVNTLLRPLLVILTCPLVVLTLGLFTLVINALLLMATGAVSRHWGLGFAVDGFWPALLGGIIVGLTSTVLALAIRDDQRGERAA
jgi:putative membrane protein